MVKVVVLMTATWTATVKAELMTATWTETWTALVKSELMTAT